ncbi:MAG: AraC family transcriptional regulator [Clostridia bacterium]|nr:AraC family transcriptional regulator [Clostridia bacterium]
MNMIKQLNAAIAYIERNLCEEIDTGEIARIACVSHDSFLRFFSYMTGMSLTGYIRCRRLTEAACELQRGRERIIDIAAKYGYDSADSFTRAFVRQHGITPTEARRGGALTICSPVSFHIIIKGAEKMNFRIVNLEEATVRGISKPYSTAEYSTREDLRHLMWDERAEGIPEQLCDGGWNRSDSTAFDGIWYGIWQKDSYMIARDSLLTKDIPLEQYTIPAGKYAAFTTEQGALAWEAFPRLFEQVFDAWLPTAGYRLRSEEIIEVYHLFTDKELRRKYRYYELWIPVE